MSVMFPLSVTAVAKSEQGGWLPMFPVWNSYTQEMIGESAELLTACTATSSPLSCVRVCVCLSDYLSLSQYV